MVDRPMNRPTTNAVFFIPVDTNVNVNTVNIYSLQYKCTFKLQTSLWPITYVLRYLIADTLQQISD